MRRDEHREIGTAAFNKVVIPAAILPWRLSVYFCLRYLPVEENFPTQGPPHPQEHRQRSSQPSRLKVTVYRSPHNTSPHNSP